MPKLLIFVPCEKVIIAQGDNSASLITVIQDLKFAGVVPAEGIPEDAAVPARMAIFCQWKMLPEEVGKVFEQRITLGATEEKPVVEAVNEFQVADQLQRTIAYVETLPFLKPGQYSMTLFIRRKGETEWPKEIAEYPMKVIHSFVTAPVKA